MMMMMMMMIVSGNKAIASRCLQKDQSAVLYSAPEPASAPEPPKYSLTSHGDDDDADGDDDDGGGNFHLQYNSTIAQ